MSEHNQPQINHDQSLRAGNIVSGEPFNVAEYTKHLLSSAELKELDDDSGQGHAIVDRVVGAIVANSTISGSKKEYTPADILAQFDAAVSLKTREDMYALSSSITSAAGLRETFALLAGDKRTSRFLGGLKEKAGLGVYQKGLGSLDMLEGYLHTLQSRYQQTHPDDALRGDIKNTIETEVEDFVKVGGGLETRSFLDAIRSMQSSYNSEVREYGNRINRALSQFREYGADEKLIGDTADSLKQRWVFGEHVGSKAVRFMAINYDHLLS